MFGRKTQYVSLRENVLLPCYAKFCSLDRWMTKKGCFSDIDTLKLSQNWQNHNHKCIKNVSDLWLPHTRTFIIVHSDPNTYTYWNIGMLDLFIDNVLDAFVWSIFRRAVGFQMGTHCTPLMTDLFLHSFRIIDDVSSFNTTASFYRVPL